MHCFRGCLLYVDVHWWLLRAHLHGQRAVHRGVLLHGAGRAAARGWVGTRGTPVCRPVRRAPPGRAARPTAPPASRACAGHVWARRACARAAARGPSAPSRLGASPESSTTPRQNTSVETDTRPCEAPTSRGKQSASSCRCMGMVSGENRTC